MVHSENVRVFSLKVDIEIVKCFGPPDAGWPGQGPGLAVPSPKGCRRAGQLKGDAINSLASHQHA